MNTTLSKSRPAIAFVMLSIAMAIVLGCASPMPLSGAAVSAELARVMGFGMV